MTAYITDTKSVMQQGEKMKKIIVSACLLGYNCKYSGSNNKNDAVLKLKNKYELIPVCPEEAGGLPTPRDASEISNGKVVTNKGKDVTKEFTLGAEKCFEIAKNNNCNIAVLKERSPSCGFKKIYDGTFTSTIIDGNGVFAELLDKNGVKIYNETNAEELLNDN